MPTLAGEAVTVHAVDLITVMVAVLPVPFEFDPVMEYAVVVVGKTVQLELAVSVQFALVLQT
ncbi:MAG: hypothetical protein Q8O37_00295 [Sulfuricellaceae bacterium]|nr:hypothetical protein [Sulfuricellaceae bacterium]